MPTDFLANAKPVETGSDFLANAKKVPPPPSVDLLEYAKQIGQGALNVLGGIGASVFKPVAVGQQLLTGKTSPGLQELATPPEGIAGSAGYYGGQAAQFLLPGVAEEAAAGKIGEALAGAPSIVRGAAKLLPGVASTAAVNKLQGGTAEGGAIAGATGGLLGKVAESVAPKLAESALGVRGTQRGFGKTPGAAAITETSGYRPATLERSASKAIDDIMTPLKQLYSQHPNPVSLSPALQVVDEAKRVAYHGQDDDFLDFANKLEQRLTKDLRSGQPLGQVDANRVLAIKQRIGKMKWNPNTDPGEATKLKMAVYHALDAELDRAVPEGAAMNQRVSSLIEVRRRAGIESRNAGIGQRVLGRFGARTGALIGGTGGAIYGGKKEGLPGALKYGLLGVVGPELVASPTGQMFISRNIRGVRQLPKIALPLVREEFGNK